MDCEKWLAEFLSDGQLHNVDRIREARKEKGFTRAEVKAAKKKIDAKTFQAPPEGNEPPKFYWYLGI